VAVPAGHAEHETLPSGAVRPCEQALHIPPTSENVFSLHLLHDSKLVDPISNPSLPGGQLVHVVSLCAPAAVEYVPAVQLVHAVTFVTDTSLLQVPGGQFLHEGAPSSF